MDLKGYVKNAGALTDPGKTASDTGPKGGMQRQYFAGETRAFLERQAPLASNFFQAKIQGLDPADPQGETWKEIRVVDMLSENSSTSYLLDGWKFIYFRDPAVDYVPPGAKVWFAGNCWLVCNPMNTASVVGSAVVRQCSAVWHSLDYYGRVVAEPFVLNRVATKGNANRENDAGNRAEHYLDCIMSGFGPGAGLRENDRVVLGTAAYAVRGLNDFSRAFTDQADSVGLVYFTLYRQEPTELDDLERGIAGGRSFTWQIRPNVPGCIRVGEPAALTAASLRCGTVPEEPVSYLWASSDEVVCVVDGSTARGVGLGRCVLTCVLEQNPEWAAEVEVVVDEAPAGREVRFTSPVPGQLRQYAAAVLTAACYQDGAETGETVEFVLLGPPAGCYETRAEGDGVMVRCLFPSDVPLKVEAVCGQVSVLAEIVLRG